MRDRRLYVALSAFAEEAAWELAAEIADGAELPFEVIDTAGGGFGHTPLYCYRPRTDRFIREREAHLLTLPSYLPAAHALVAAGDVEPYLRAHGEARIPADARARAELALRAFLERVFAEANEFAVQAQRFDAAYAELEDAVVAGRSATEVVVPILGLEIGSESIEMGDGLSLVRGDLFEDAPAEAVWDGDHARVLAVVRGDDAIADRAPAHIRRLVTSLRLYDASCVALGPAAWVRSAGGPWHLVLVGGGARARGVCAIPSVQEDELRAFTSLIARRLPRGGEVAWALRRYEIGCEQPQPFERLTDHLLALRALLEPEGPQSARLAGRLAALCAPEDERAALAQRTGHAIALERAAVAGHAPLDGLVLELVDELSGHLRALLRDVLCGHLDADLRTLADELLLDGHQLPGHQLPA
jgi:hypothetical protein